LGQGLQIGTEQCHVGAESAKVNAYAFFYKNNFIRTVSLKLAELSKNIKNTQAKDFSANKNNSRLNSNYAYYSSRIITVIIQ